VKLQTMMRAALLALALTVIGLPTEDEEDVHKAALPAIRGEIEFAALPPHFGIGIIDGKARRAQLHQTQFGIHLRCGKSAMDMAFRRQAGPVRTNDGIQQEPAEESDATEGKPRHEVVELRMDEEAKGGSKPEHQGVFEQLHDAANRLLDPASGGCGRNRGLVPATRGERLGIRFAVGGSPGGRFEEAFFLHMVIDPRRGDAD